MRDIVAKNRMSPRLPVVKSRATLIAAVCATALALSWAGRSFAAGRDLRLVEAVQHRDGKAARALIKEAVDVNAAQPDGATAVAWAAHWDDLEIADFLIRAGADVNTPNDLRVTPLM